MRPLAIMTALGVLGAHAQPLQSNTGPFVVTGNDAYMIEAPRQVCDLYVSSVTMLKSGSFGIIGGVDLPRGFIQKMILSDPGANVKMPQAEWSVWDTAKNKTYPIQVTLTGPASIHVEETAVPNVAYLTVVEYGSPGQDPSAKSHGYRLDLSTGAARAILQGNPDDDGGYSTVIVSPTRPYLIQMSSVIDRPVDPADRKTKVSFKVIDFEGKVLKQGAGTVKGIAMFSSEGWSADGSFLVANQMGSSGRGDGILKLGTAVLDPARGTIVETQEQIPMRAFEAPGGPLALETHAHALTVDKETSRTVMGLWLASKEPSEARRSLVSANCDGMSYLAPDMSFVAFVSGGRLYRSDLVKADYAVYKQAKLAALKTAALSKVKQIALSVLIFASDNNDSAPGQGNFSDSIMPYLKSQELLDGFVYTFKGGKLADIKDPSSTELGYVNVQGGRCVAYVDGHAKFVRDP